MELTINGKTYSFKFGIAFLRELDKAYFVESNGIKFGAGLEVGLAQLMGAQNPVAVFEFLMAANKTEKPRLGEQTLSEYLENEANIDELIKQVGDELSENNLTKGKVMAVKNTAK